MDKFYPASNDGMFKLLFGTEENVKFLKILICEILSIAEEEIEDIYILNPEIPKENLNMKSVRLDIRSLIKFKGTNGLVNVEMQTVTYLDIFERALYYWASIHRDALNIGQEYLETKKTISIWILSQNIDQKPIYHRTAVLKEKNTNEIMSDNLEIHFIELPKMEFPEDKMLDKGKSILKILALNTWEEINAMQQNINITETNQIIEKIAAYNESRTLRQIVEQREQAQRDELREMFLQQKIQQAEKKNLALQFIIELAKGFAELPEYVKQSNEKCTVFDFIRIITTDSVTSTALENISQQLADIIVKFENNGGTIEELSIEVEIPTEDLLAFKNKYTV
jgi:predicted transposase/invertase (TIGR01784 family)